MSLTPCRARRDIVIEFGGYTCSYHAKCNTRGVDYQLLMFINKRFNLSRHLCGYLRRVHKSRKTAVPRIYTYLFTARAETIYNFRSELNIGVARFLVRLVWKQQLFRTKPITVIVRTGGSFITIC